MQGALNPPIRRWLDSAQGLSVRLEGSACDPRADLQAYRLLLATSDSPHAGTDGDVFVELVGAAGSSGWRRLTSGSQVGVVNVICLRYDAYMWAQACSHTMSLPVLLACVQWLHK